MGLAQHIYSVQMHPNCKMMMMMIIVIIYYCCHYYYIIIIEWANALVPPTPFQGGRTECA